MHHAYQVLKLANLRQSTCPIFIYKEDHGFLVISTQALPLSSAQAAFHGVTVSEFDLESLTVLLYVEQLRQLVLSDSGRKKKI